MNKFFAEYQKQLSSIHSDDDLAKLYRWFWDSKEIIKATAGEINKSLKLTGKYEIKSDLPCLSVGSTKGLLVLCANPGWKEELSPLEEACCQRSPEEYIDLMSSFFERHPDVVGKRVPWWSKPFWFVRLLKSGLERFGNAKSSEEKWHLAHTSKLIGGWELFPFHSESDGISDHICSDKHDDKWLRVCAEESVRAAIRMSPEVLLIASKVGSQIIHRLLPPDAKWRATTLSNTQLSYCNLCNDDGQATEIFSIPHQIFSAPRKFTNQDILTAANLLRGNPQLSTV
jgi:hypothetical protein